VTNKDFSRRDWLTGITFGAVAGAMGASSARGQTPPVHVSSAVLNVRDFGAVGDGKTDDTPAFANALKAASDGNIKTVFVPFGQYAIKGNLVIPANVCLQGCSQAPARNSNDGSVLFATADAGKAEGTPFITLHTNASLRGITIFYPEQKMTNPPVAYPWTIRGSGDNISLLDVLLVNPYQAVDFGTTPAGRHFISGLYGQPLYRGLFIDQCYDVGRIENVHFWSFWGGWEGPLYEFMRKEAIAFILARTDWEFISNCFCIGYHIGYHFTQRNSGPGNCLLTQCGSDIGPTAVRVESSQSHAGISFVNGQFMSGIEVAEGNSGPVKFTACGFWGIATTDHHALLNGNGHVTFNSCHFIGWAQKDLKAPAIHAKRGGVTISNCDFIDLGKTQVVVENAMDAAIIVGNRLRGQNLITNHAQDRAQIGLNVVTPK
jgi:hypothetical protein